MGFMRMLKSTGSSVATSRKASFVFFSTNSNGSDVKETVLSAGDVITYKVVYKYQLKESKTIKNHPVEEGVSITVSDPAYAEEITRRMFEAAGQIQRQRGQTDRRKAPFVSECHRDVKDEKSAERKEQSEIPQDEIRHMREILRCGPLVPANP